MRNLFFESVRGLTTVGYITQKNQKKINTKVKMVKWLLYLHPRLESRSHQIQDLLFFPLQSKMNAKSLYTQFIPPMFIDF